MYNFNHMRILNTTFLIYKWQTFYYLHEYCKIQVFPPPSVGLKKKKTGIKMVPRLRQNELFCQIKIAKSKCFIFLFA